MTSPIPSRLKISFQAKVLIPVIGLLIILPLITGWILDRHIETSAHEEAQKSLTTVRAVFRNSLELRTRNFEVRFRNMANEPRFKAVTQLGDTDTLKAFLQETLKDLDQDTKAILFTPADPSQNSTGVLRDKSQSIEAFETKVIPLVEQALAGNISSSLTLHNRKALNLVAVPIVINQGAQPLGVLTLGIEFGQRAVNDLKSLTRTEVVLYAEDTWIAETIGKDRLAGHEDAFFNGTYEGLQVQPHLIGNEHFHILTGKLKNPINPAEPLNYVLLSSYEESLRALSATRTVLFTVCIFGIGVSVVIILILIRNLTRPIRELRDGAEAVGRGDFSQRVDIRSKDECGELAFAFNNMTSNLQSSRQQLEANVRELTETQNQLLHREARLRESEEGLRLIIEGARDHVIFTIDYDGNIQRWNGAAERMLGYNSTEVKHITYPCFFDDQDRKDEIHEEILKKASREGRAEFEGWRIGKDQNRFWADVTLSKLEKLPGSENGGFVEIARDITTRKQAEKALVDARNAAEASNRAKNEFMGNMSHEIRTPMNGIIGMSSLLMEEDLSEEQRDLTETIRTSADSLMAIIDDILDISKIEAGQLEFTLSPVNLVELLEITAESFAHVCAEKHLELNVCVDHNVPHLFNTDPTRVRQVLSNLIGNAVKFTEEGAIRIGMRYDLENKFITFSVEDTGVGVPEDKIEQLFEPFFQVESNNSRRFGGNGLGLSISRRIAELLNGEIRVESVLNQGSNFKFKIRTASLNDEERFTNFQGTQVLIVANPTENNTSLIEQTQHWEMKVKKITPSLDTMQKALRDNSLDLLIIDDSEPMSSSALAEIHKTIELLGENFPPYVRLLPHNAKSPTHWPGHSEGLTKPIHPSELHSAFASLLNTDKTSAPRKLNQLSSRKRLNSDFALQYPYQILIAEDNTVNAKVLVTILKRLGFEPGLAINGEECVQALKKTAYDIVFMDLQMPVMDGYKATLRILNSDTIIHPVFITAFTANARQDDRDACASVGMHDFVAKPARPQKIIDVIRRAHDWFSRIKKREMADVGSLSPIPHTPTNPQADSPAPSKEPPAC